MEKATFSTTTNPILCKKHSQKVFAVTGMVLCLLSCFGLLISFNVFCFIEFIVIVTIALFFFVNNQKSYSWKLKFEGDTLYIEDLNSFKRFVVYNIPASDIVIKQSEEEKRSDYCRLRIKKTIFQFGGVKNCSQLKEYIQKYYE